MASLPKLVIAGSRVEFEYLCRENDWKKGECRYVDEEWLLRGRSKDSPLYVYGTWRRNSRAVEAVDVAIAMGFKPIYVV